MSSRKIVGRIIRYGLVVVFIIPIIGLSLMEIISNGLTVTIDFCAKYIELFAAGVNIKLTAWERNTPEDTMDILKNTEIK